MRRTASEVIRDLEIRVAHLERSASTPKSAGGGAGVEVCLSGDSRKNRVLHTTVDTAQLYPILGRRGKITFKGLAKIEDVSLVSYMDQQDIHGEAAFIDGTTIEIEDFTKYIMGPREVNDIITDVSISSIVSLKNTMEGRGYVRIAPPDSLDISGDIELEIQYSNSYWVSVTVGFTAVAKTTDEFEDAWLALDSTDDDDL